MACLLPHLEEFYYFRILLLGEEHALTPILSLNRNIRVPFLQRKRRPLVSMRYLHVDSTAILRHLNPDWLFGQGKG